MSPAGVATGRCPADGTWSACTEAIAAADEVLDSKDNDCDGETDEGLTGTPTIECPVSFDSLPARWWALRCEDLCSASGGPCDCTWSIVPPAGSGSVEVPDRTAETTRVYLDASGACSVTPLGTPTAPDVQGDFSRDYF